MKSALNHTGYVKQTVSIKSSYPEECSTS